MAKKAVKSLNSPAYDSLIDLLRSVREETGLTAHALSKAIGEDQMFVYKVEHRERRLDLVEFVQICNGLGIQPVELFQRWLENQPQVQK